MLFANQSRAFAVTSLTVLLCACGGSGPQSELTSPTTNTDAELVQTTTEPAGSNCTYGGINIRIGQDSNGNGSLDSGEFTSTYACNGIDGDNGLGTLSVIATEPAGANCQYGGRILEVGVDNNGNDTLDTGEVDQTSYLCHGADGSDGLSSLSMVSAEPAGSNCAQGGHKVDSGMDSDGNGTLDTGEVQQSHYVCHGTNGTDGSNGLSTLSIVSAEPAGTQCSQGGQRLDIGIDDNDDGILQAGEIDQTGYVCNASNGADGSNGLHALSVLSAEPAGANCSQGGQRIDIGLDDNTNGTLDAGEIDQTSYVCHGSDGTNGSDGTDGSNGLNTLSLTSNESPGANCSQGGQRLDIGLDDNSNGTLDAGEIDQTSYICHGTNGSNGADGTDGNDKLISLSPTGLDPFDMNCILSGGGQKLEVGTDDNRDGILDAAEVNQTAYICDGFGLNGMDGADGADGTDGLSSLSVISVESAGSNCAQGGQKIDNGLDDNSNGILEVGEIDQTAYACHGANGADGADGADGSNGLNALSTISIESAGVNCAQGGQKLDTGLDDNNNGTLEAGEIDQTSYICHGTDGANGADGADGSNGLPTLSVISAESAGVNCAAGGQKLEVGLDDNSNGTLEAGEIDQTSYVCHGADGANGADGADGSNGLSTLSVMSVESAGVNCAQGGQKIDVGVDDNNNGTLEAGEIDQTSYVCDGTDGADGADGSNGLNSLTLISAEPAGVNCPQGGQKVENGLDDNSNGTLEAGEVDQTDYICGDITAPVLTQVTPVATPARTYTPSYTFNASEIGWISYGGDCASDTLLVTAGNNTIVFNTLVNGSYSNCTVQLTDFLGNSSNVLAINTFTVSWVTKPLNDTGTTGCADYAYTDGGNYAVTGSGTHNVDLQCSTQPVVPTTTNDGYDSDGDIIRGGQDAMFGRDVTHDDDSDGFAGFSFTKLDSSGNPLADQSVDYATTPWSCVLDNVTGLIWEVKTTSGLQNTSSTYTWYNSTGVNDGGSAGTANGGTCSDGTGCDTEKYVADINAMGLCGATDWRLPNHGEILSIDHNDGSAPYIDTRFFPNTASDLYWSSSVVAYDIDQAIGLYLNWGVISNDLKATPYRVRLVREN